MMVVRVVRAFEVGSERSKPLNPDKKNNGQKEVWERGVTWCSQRREDCREMSRLQWKKHCREAEGGCWALAHITAQKLSVKKALKRAFTGEGSALNTQSQIRWERRGLNLALTNTGILKKKQKTGRRKRKKKSGDSEEWRGRLKNEYRAERTEGDE